MKYLIALQLLLSTNTTNKTSRERGSVTLEQAVIAGALFIAAVVVVGVIVGAVNLHIGHIR